MDKFDNTAPYQSLGSTYLHRSLWRSFRLDRVHVGEGMIIEYSYAETPNAIFVVPLTHDGQIVLLRHYRYPVREWTTEIVAGSLDHPGEDPAAAVHRELLEEIGGRATELVHLSSAYSSSGHITLKGEYYLATGVRINEAERLEEDLSIIRPVALPAREALAMARRGEINEGQSALALLLAEPHILQRLAPPGN